MSDPKFKVQSMNFSDYGGAVNGIRNKDKKSIRLVIIVNKPEYREYRKSQKIREDLTYYLKDNDITTSKISKWVAELRFTIYYPKWINIWFIMDGIMNFLEETDWG